MTATEWIVLISAILYLCLGIVAFRFPRGRENWKKDRLETLYIAMSATVFLMLLFLLWYASAMIDWPDALTVIIWGSAIALVMLVLIGIFVPNGIRMSFAKKEKKAVAEEEE